MATNRKYTWKKDKEDPRDYLYASGHLLMAQTPLPPKMDLSAWCSPVMNQGAIGSCTAQALAAAFEYLQLRNIRFQISLEGTPLLFDPSKFSSVSRLFIYYNERVMEGTIMEDSGAQIRDGVKVLAKQGVCRELLWPYGEEYLFKKPVAPAYAEAAKHKVLHYQRLSSVNEIKHSLANQYPVVFGFFVYENFESEDCATNGILKMPEANEQLYGGHAVMAVGYDDSKQMLKVRNSWGQDWGLDGHFWMPYSYVTQKLAMDFWTLRA